MALLVTHLSASMAGVVWAGLEWSRFGKPSMVGVVTGVVAGLATVTPASGFIGPIGALVLGAAGALICYFAVEIVKHRLRIDDSLDVFAVHGVGGILGTLMVAALAAAPIGGTGYPITGGVGAQAGVQLLGVAAVVVWSAVVSLAILMLTRLVVGLRAGDAQIEEGLDLTQHGERAYTP
jgi:Amt family ammonium transporter